MDRFRCQILLWRRCGTVHRSGWLVTWYNLSSLIGRCIFSGEHKKLWHMTYSYIFFTHQKYKRMSKCRIMGKNKYFLCWCKNAKIIFHELLSNQNVQLVFLMQVIICVIFHINKSSVSNIKVYFLTKYDISTPATLVHTRLLNAWMCKIWHIYTRKCVKSPRH